MKPIVVSAIAAPLLAAGPAAADMTLGFEWGNIPLCTSGRPNIVPNPEFIMHGVPKGTDTITFRLKDLDVPSYNHGGGAVKVQLAGSIKVPSGLFRYNSPCPPSGVHTYEWTATAKHGNKALATAKARRKYPE